MFNRLKFVILSLSLFLHQIVSIQSTNIATQSVDRVVAIESLKCIQKYFAHRYKDMDKVRFNVILVEPLLHGSDIEQLFLQKSNEQFYNPITLVTLASIDEKQKNYLIFLSPGVLGNLNKIPVPKVHDDSFLYVFFEYEEDVSTSWSDIYSKFTPSFEQNIVLMTTSRNSSEHLWEWNAFRIVLHKCMNAKEYKLVKIGRCRRDANAFQPFALKPLNTEACPVQVAGIYNPPFTVHDQFRGFYSGVEYYLVQLISEHMQMPVNYTFFDFAMATAIINELFLPNSTTHPKNSASLGFTDILIGGFRYNTFNFFETSIAFMQNERTWCVSRAKPIPVWLNMWRITTKPIWCMALVTIYLEGLVLYLLMQYERGHTGYMKKDYHYCVLMMAMSAFAGMPHITYRPKSKRMSLFFGLMLITGILISTAWNCFLIKVLTSPIYNAQISTISELMEHDYRLVGSYNGKEFMMQQPSKYPADKLYFGYADVQSLLEKLRWNDNLAVATSILLAENNPLIRKSEMYCFSRSENIHILPVVLRLALKYEFLSEINVIIRRSLEAGLVEKWQRDSSLYQNDPKRMDDRKIILSVDHIGGALLALFCGLSVASLTFIAECIAFRRSNRRNCTRFWLLVSKAVDGRRMSMTYLLKFIEIRAPRRIWK